MPFVPQLVGGVTVRERPSRYVGEPKYRRLDFVRSKSAKTSQDSWPIIYSSDPVRGIQLYSGPGYYQQWPAQHSHHFHQGNHAAHMAALRQLYPPDHPVWRVPMRPLDAAHPRPAIEAKPQIMVLDSDDEMDEDDDEDEIIQIIEKPSKSKGKSKSKRKEKIVISSGHSIFDSDSDDDRPPKPRRRRGH